MMRYEKLDKEVWLNTAENLKKSAPPLAAALAKLDYEGRGKEDAEDFLRDIHLAYTAVCYVAQFATDKCLFIIVPESEGGR